jgi:hypothetical protein
MARVKSEDEKREIKNKNYTQEVQSTMSLPYEYREFMDQESAYTWLINEMN